MGNEDFTDAWIENDGLGKITRTASRVTWANSDFLKLMVLYVLIRY